MGFKSRPSEHLHDHKVIEDSAIVLQGKPENPADRQPADQQPAAEQVRLLTRRAKRASSEERSLNKGEFAKEEFIFFEHLWRNESYRRLFFTHKEDLFFNVDVKWLQFRFLLWASPYSESHQSILTATSQSNSKWGNISRDIELIFSEKIGEIAPKVRIAALLYLLRFIDSNPVIRDLLEHKIRSYSAVAARIRDTPFNFNIFTEFTGVLREFAENEPPSVVLNPQKGEMPPQADPILSAEVSKLKKHLPSLIGKLANHSLLIPNQADEMLVALYEALSTHQELLLLNRSLSKNDYEQVLVELYLAQLLGPMHTIFWCSSCHDDATRESTRSRISPAKMRNRKCPKCGKREDFMSVYRIHDDIAKVFDSRDGMLARAVQWLLEDRKIKYQSNVFFGDNEVEFVLGGKEGCILLECKMHKTGKDEDAIRNAIRSGISQVSKTVQRARQEGWKVAKAWLVTNYQHDSCQEAIDKGARDFKRGLHADNIQIVDAEELPRQLSKYRF